MGREVPRFAWGHPVEAERAEWQNSATISQWWPVGEQELDLKLSLRSPSAAKTRQGSSKLMLTIHSTRSAGMWGLAGLRLAIRRSFIEYSVPHSLSVPSERGIHRQGKSKMDRKNPPLQTQKMTSSDKAKS